MDPCFLVSGYRALGVAELVSAHLWVGLVHDTAGCWFCGFLKLVSAYWCVRLDSWVAA